jgi:hypothetical protein
MGFAAERLLSNVWPFDVFFEDSVLVLHLRICMPFFLSESYRFDIKACACEAHAQC